MQNHPIKKMRKILKQNNYTHIRTRGSHETYSNGINTITVVYPVTNALLAKRLIRENNLVV